MGLDLAVPVKRSPEDESLASFFRRRLGRQAFERMLEPLMAGIYAGDAEQMSVQATFPRFVELEQQYGSVIRGMMASRNAGASATHSGPKRTMFVSLKNGLSDLVDALVHRLTDHGVVLKEAVRSTRCVYDPISSGRWMYDVILNDGYGPVCGQSRAGNPGLCVGGIGSPSDSHCRRVAGYDSLCLHGHDCDGLSACIGHRGG